VSAAYNFTLPGEGKYSIEASNLFHYVDAENNAVALRAENVALHTAVKGQLAVARNVRPTATRKRATYDGCSSSQKSDLTTAAAAAQSYAAGAQSYLSSHTSSTTRYTTWFGTFTSARHSQVLTHYTNMVNFPYANYEYDCSTCDEPDTYAYTFPDE
jgi:peptidyl-Lys metalloendopeptidase